MRRRLLVAAQVVFAAAAIWFASARILAQWREARTAGSGFAPTWWMVALSCLIVFASYVVLIQSWRVMVAGWGGRLSFADASRIWFVSNLGRYIPGKIWQIGAMGVLAERAGVSPMVAASSAIIVNLVNLVAGVAVVAVTGASLLHQPRLMIVGAIVAGIGLLATPYLLPHMIRLAQVVTGRTFRTPLLTLRPIWIVAATSAVAWVAYGLAFRVFAEGISPAAAGNMWSYVAVFTASYLAGYVFLPAPGGIGVREYFLVLFLDQMHLASGGAGVLIALGSRLWLTVLEVLPGAVYLALGAGRAGSSKSKGDDSTD